MTQNDIKNLRILLLKRVTPRDVEEALGIAELLNRIVDATTPQTSEPPVAAGGTD